MRIVLATLLLVVSVLSPNSVWGQAEGFTNELVIGDFEAAVGVAFAADGRAVVWEKTGRVWTVVDGVRDAAPLLDISEEIANYGDYGLVGLALDPDFMTNGHFYLLYAVDYHHLEYFGTGEYEPSVNEYFRATIGRITRYTAESSSNFHTTDLSSRTILIGETKTSGIPLMAQSHGPGALVFGRDGTLLASIGDGASSQVVDTGGDSQGTYTMQGLGEGILRSKENVGAYRAQLIDCLNGKILRIDPATGDGVPSNPFYDSGDPDAPRSRVWALGFRQPYRMTIEPGSGSTNPADGNPGTLYVGDVGWAVWEELSVCTAGGQNFGWPVYEGLELHPGYSSNPPNNTDAPNPLGCASYFDFRDLLKQETTDPDPFFGNPCSPGVEIPSSVTTFVHRRPVLEWNHASTVARTGTFSGSSATTAVVGAPGSPVQGAPFGGSCSTGGTWYSGTVYPAEYQDRYFHGDFVGGWVRMVTMDATDRPTVVVPFADVDGIVGMAENPVDGMIYVISYTNELRRIAYAPCGNQPPVAAIAVDQAYGPGPLTVQFDAGGSSDPDGDALTYSWDFGDGGTSSQMNPNHTFNAAAGVPTPFDVTLTVTDPFGGTATVQQIISVNNTPPVIDVTSPLDGELYSITGDSVFPCDALVSDAEHTDAELFCAWQLILHHDTHMHPEPIDPECTTTIVTSPVGCGSEVYFYRLVLTVTDAAGLSTTEEVMLLPDCSASPLGVIHLTLHPHDLTVVSGDDVEFEIHVENAGATDLENVVIDTVCDTLTLAGGDENLNGVLETSETWTYVCTINNVTASFTQSVAVTAEAPTGTISESHDLPVLVVPGNARVTAGQIAVYLFDEGSGSTVLDQSGVSPPLDLTIGSTGAVDWISGGGLDVNSSTTIVTAGPAGRLTDRLQVTQEFTVEAWAKPQSNSQSGPARIVTLSVDPFPTGGNFMLGQSNDSLDFRLRTTNTNQFGLPGVPLPTGLAQTQLSHWVVTRSVCSGLRFYQDGVLVSEEPLSGDLAGWDDTAILSLANEPTSDRPWLGELHLVAVFDRSLDEGEVAQNFGAGPQGLLIGPPTIVEAPSSIGLCEGDNATLEVTADGAQPILFQWRRDGVAIPGATASSYTLTSVQPADSAAYDVVVSNPVGSVVSAPALVTVTVPPQIVTSPVSVEVCENEVASFFVSASGPIAGYEWFLDGVSLGAGTQNFTIDQVKPEDLGDYTVVVSGACGSVTSDAATLSFLPMAICAPPFVRGDCSADGSINVGDPVKVLARLFLGETVDCEDACDINDDGTIDVADALYSLSAQFSGAAPPPTPFPSCGEDPTPDGLGCTTFTPCP